MQSARCQSAASTEAAALFTAVHRPAALACTPIRTAYRCERVMRTSPLALTTLVTVTLAVLGGYTAWPTVRITLLGSPTIRRMLQSSAQEQATQALMTAVQSMECIDFNTMTPDIHACPTPPDWLNRFKTAICYGGNIRLEIIDALVVLSNDGYMGFTPVLNPSSGVQVQTDIPTALRTIGGCMCSSQLDASDSAWADLLEVITLMTGVVQAPSVLDWDPRQPNLLPVGQTNSTRGYERAYELATRLIDSVLSSSLICSSDCQAAIVNITSFGLSARGRPREPPCATQTPTRWRSGCV